MTGYATAPDIAKMLNIRVGYVYYLAHHDKWRRTRSLPRRYNLEDVQVTWQRLHAPIELEQAGRPRACYSAAVPRHA